MADGGPRVPEILGEGSSYTNLEALKAPEAEDTKRAIFGGGDPKKNAENAQEIRKQEQIDKDKSTDNKQQAEQQTEVNIGGGTTEGQADNAQPTEEQEKVEEQAEQQTEVNIGGGTTEGQADNAQPTGEQEKVEEQAEQEQYKNSPDYPILQRLKEYAPKEEFEIALKNFQEAKDKDESRRIVLDLAKSLSDPVAREKFTKQLEGNKEKVDEKNFKDTEFAKDAKNSNLKLDKGIGGLEVMLAENYVSVPKEVDKENEAKTKNKEKDIKTAVDVVTNQIVEKNTPDFKNLNQTLINEIKTATTLQDSYAKLKELYKNNLKKDAERGGTQAKNEISLKQASIKEKAEELNRQYAEAQKMSDDGIDKQLKLSELEAKYREIIAEGNDVSDFEAEIKSLSGGKQDKSPENKDIDPSTIA